MKGTEVHRGRSFASKSFKPSAEADGKREDGGIADTDTYMAGSIGNPKRKRGLSGRASSGGRRRSGRSLRCLSEASFAGDSGVFARSSLDD
ncbi:MAG: hypothetical protein EGQ00_16120 [Parabacteroides johnsonii]|nr:hypothetical protein [Parabacteroides johnsonii]